MPTQRSCVPKRHLRGPSLLRLGKGGPLARELPRSPMPLSKLVQLAIVSVFDAAAANIRGRTAHRRRAHVPYALDRADKGTTWMGYATAHMSYALPCLRRRGVRLCVVPQHLRRLLRRAPERRMCDLRGAHLPKPQCRARRTPLPPHLNLPRQRHRPLLPRAWTSRR